MPNPSNKEEELEKVDCFTIDDLSMAWSVLHPKLIILRQLNKKAESYAHSREESLAREIQEMQLDAEVHHDIRGMERTQGYAEACSDIKALLLAKHIDHA